MKNCEKKLSYDECFITVTMTCYVLWKLTYRYFPLPPFSSDNLMVRIKRAMPSFIRGGSGAVRGAQPHRAPEYKGPHIKKLY